MVEVRPLRGQGGKQSIQALSKVLLDCVQGGASVSFMASLSSDEANSFFADVLREVDNGCRILLGAFNGPELLGTVQVNLAMPPNQPHRADIAKLLVLRSARGQGIGQKLMKAAEDASREAGKTLLVLDTASPEAERLYTRMGWTRVGSIPDYALLPDGDLCATTIFYKRLA